MKRYVIPTAAFVICLMIGISALSNSASAMENTTEFNTNVSDHKISTISSNDTFDFNEKCAYWLKHGYSSIPEYQSALKEMKEEIEGSADSAVYSYSSVMTDEQKENLYLYEEKMLNTNYIEIFDNNKELFDEIISDCKSKMPVKTYSYSSKSYSGGSSSYYEGGSGKLTKSGGVNDYNGRTETWYSSNRRRHYRTNEWTTDSNGVYRDADGYVVVAASDVPQGSTIETSHGTGKVYDSGCNSGVTDIYTEW